MQKTGEIFREEIRSLVRPSSSREECVHNWYVFPHGFSPGLVDFLVEDLGLETDSCVVDPYLGGGTTVVECAKIGLKACGSDILPLATFVTDTKMKASRYPCEGPPVISAKGETESQPWDKYFRKAFPPVVLEDLERVWTGIEEMQNIIDRDFAVLVFFRTMEEVSYASKGGAFLRWNRRKRYPRGYTLKRYQQLFDLLVSERPTTADDGPFSDIQPQYLVTVADARTLPYQSGFADAVITSPPYLNRHDYTRVYLLELLSGFCQNLEEVKRIRYNTMRSHVEARSPSYIDSSTEVQSKQLEEVTDRLRRSSDLTNPKIPETVEGYFEDLNLSLTECYRILGDGGFCCIVMSNVRFSGVMIPVDEILVELATDLGFDLVRKFLSRYRGNSPQQMAKYGSEPSKECVVVLEK